MHQELAILLALTAAFLFAVSNVVEQRVAAQAPMEESLRPRLLVRLFRHPAWQGGFVADVGGYGAQAAALAFGALLLVAPLIACGLLFSLLLEARLARTRLPTADLVAAALLCGGVGLFLGIGDPSGGRAVVAATRWAPVAIVGAAIIGLCAVGRRRARGPARAMLFGLAAGLTFGINSAVTKTVVHVIADDGVLHVFTRWELYALAVLSLGGLLIVQSAFQAGSLKSALPALEVSEPVVATIIGAAILDEHLHADTLVDRVLIAVSITAMLYGTLALARSEGERGQPADRVGVAHV